MVPVYCRASSGKPRILFSDPPVTGKQKHPITEYQPVFFSAESFADAQAKLHNYAANISGRAIFRYHPYTQSIETLHTRAQTRSLTKEIKNDLTLVIDCLNLVLSKSS